MTTKPRQLSDAAVLKDAASFISFHAGLLATSYIKDRVAQHERLKMLSRRLLEMRRAK